MEQLGSVEQPGWVHAYVRRDGKWRLAGHGWQTPHSDQLAQQVQERNAGLPVYVVRWDPVGGNVQEGVYQPPKLWLPRQDGMAAPGGLYRWSGQAAGGADKRAEHAQFQGFMNVQSWPQDAAPPDDWPAEDRDPKRWRMQAALPEGVPAVHLPDVKLWAQTTVAVPHGWLAVSSSPVWLGGGATYRLSTRPIAPVTTVRERLGKVMTVTKSWGPSDALPSDWPSTDRSESRNRFEVTVPPKFPAIDVGPIRAWAWSVPAAAIVGAPIAVGSRR